jgi:chromosome segregation ATPase
MVEEANHRYQNQISDLEKEID